jgi:hypothetical protein
MKVKWCAGNVLLLMAKSPRINMRKITLPFGTRIMSAIADWKGARKPLAYFVKFCIWRHYLAIGISSMDGILIFYSSSVTITPKQEII